MLSVLGFLVILCPLVIVHELGHFLFARLFNVKAEVFSVGFGPKLWSKQIGETEWRVAAIPLGGFVKLLGEDPSVEMSTEDKKRALQNAKPWQRFFIFFGGPLFNFLFAILVFMVILVIGEPQLASVVGRVVEGSPAQGAGFVSGDRILTIDGQPVTRWSEVVVAVNERPGKVTNFEVERDSSTRVITTQIQSEEGYSMYGELKPVGRLDGLAVEARSLVLGVSDEKSMAGRAGLKTGDEVVEINTTKLSSWEELERRYRAIEAGSTFTIGIKSSGSIKDLTFQKPRNSRADLGKDLGIFSSELFVERAVDGSPAAAVGLKPGDRVAMIGKETILSFAQLREAIQKSGESVGSVDISWVRGGRTLSAKLTPTETTTRDAVLRKTKQFTIGVAPMLSFAPPSVVTERVLNPFMLLYRGSERMVDLTYRNFVSIQKMITGDASVGSIGGPVLIGKLAGESLTRGWIAFLSLMAMLSVGLGVLNILPVPVLDGGHLMLLSIEMVRGKPLSLRQMEIAQGVGLSLILLLMVVVIRNDLSRLPIFN